jgi:hypothetical protein
MPKSCDIVSRRISERHRISSGQLQAVHQDGAWRREDTIPVSWGTAGIDLAPGFVDSQFRAISLTIQTSQRRLEHPRPPLVDWLPHFSRRVPFCLVYRQTHR